MVGISKLQNEGVKISTGTLPQWTKTPMSLFPHGQNHHWPYPPLDNITKGPYAPMDKITKGLYPPWIKSPKGFINHG